MSIICFGSCGEDYKFTKKCRKHGKCRDCEIMLSDKLSCYLTRAFLYLVGKQQQLWQGYKKRVYQILILIHPRIGMMIGLVQIMEETAAEGAMASRLPKLSIRKDLHPLDVWKSSMTSLLISSELREMTLPEMRSAFRICAASAESESMHTLTKRVSGYLPDSAASDIKRLAIRDPASDADQKLRSTLFPFRGARSAEDFEESTREGASEPISREWLP